MPEPADSTVPVPSAGGAALRPLSPAGRIAAIADAGRVAPLDTARASPWLARFGIAPQADDGVVTARIAIGGAPWLVAAQDERFLGGSVGAAHGAALRALFEPPPHLDAKRLFFFGLFEIHSGPQPPITLP